jgi:hypothetical protein
MLLGCYKEDTYQEVKEKCEAVGFDYILNKPFTEKDIQIIKLFMRDKN